MPTGGPRLDLVFANSAAALFYSGRGRLRSQPKTVRCVHFAAVLICMVSALAAMVCTRPLMGQKASINALREDIDAKAAKMESRLISWRRDLHQNPELSNRELRTAGIVAAHLKKLGIEVRTGVAHTGVVGVLRGGLPGGVVALRADMDALPVTEEVDLPFASKVRTQYSGQEVGVMHACGHDLHVSMLMGAAEVLAGIREKIPGTVKFIFQPAEEGPPAGEDGGAEIMVKEGALENPKAEAIFGLHVFPYPVGQIAYRAGGIMASSDSLKILVRGRQSHGALPWRGIDPVVTASQIVLGLQTITSRQVDLTTSPAIITIGSIHGGVRYNIIPDMVEMEGTIRTFDPAMQADIHARVKRVAEGIAGSAGASAEVTISRQNPVTYNDPQLTDRMSSTLKRIAGNDLIQAIPTTTAEDFSRYQERIPGLFFFLGITPKNVDPAIAAPNHSPRFFADESALVVGVRALSQLAVDYLSGSK
jgi:amidohydrolase